jgi:HlyD family secretion protein
MPVEVMIRTGERTPLEYLVQPISRSLARAWREK